MLTADTEYTWFIKTCSILVISNTLFERWPKDLLMDILKRLYNYKTQYHFDINCYSFTHSI